MADRYDVANSSEGRYQPGSDNRVLANKLGITDPSDMDDVELELLDQLTDAVINEVTFDKRLTVADVYEWHRRWLGNVYEWAGKERSVNMGKDAFQFAAAGQIPRLMDVFDSKFLAIYTPCAGMADEPLVEAIAVVHIEFVLVHPFREGNGRLSRLIAIVMALQAGKPVLDFSYLDNNKSRYFSAIQAGLADYKPMTDLFRQVLRDSG
ncbi:MAG: Fic family protein [Gammaproteobacteria bacterium]|nr:Fic family protein [Gammaproteobacteria bacterium]